LGYWVLIGSTFADPRFCPWIAQFYADTLAMPTTALIIFMVDTQRSKPRIAVKPLPGNALRDLFIDLDRQKAQKPPMASSGPF